MPTRTTILPVQDSYVIRHGLIYLQETVSAQVTVAANGQPVPQGTVTFGDGDLLPAVAPVQGGRATYTFFNPTDFVRPVSAAYTGTGLFTNSSAGVDYTPPPPPPQLQAEFVPQACVSAFFENLVSG
jgi:hypothetical protein